MSIFKIKRTAEAVKENTGGGKYINKSGIYDVIIKIASIKANTHNAREVDFNLEYEGNTTTIYGLKLDNNDGSENYQAEIFNKLCIIADLEDVADPEMETHKFGDKEIDLAVLPDFTDLPVKVRVQEEFGKYQDRVTRRLAIKNFFREDGATAAEILADVPKEEIGKQLEKDIAYAEKPAYKNGVTPEEVEAFLAEKSGKKADNSPELAKTAPVKQNLFARK